jgi:hypothetical protein
MAAGPWSGWMPQWRTRGGGVRRVEIQGTVYCVLTIDAVRLGLQSMAKSCSFAPRNLLWCAVAVALLTPVSCLAAGGDTSSVILVSGTLAGQAVTAASRTISVQPGAAISGSYTVQVNSTFPSTAWVELAMTPSWGVHSTSYEDLGRLSTPVSGLSRAISVSLTAPITPGTYYITTAFGGELNAAQVMSCTNWAAGSPMWNNGDDVADWTASTIAAANANGRAEVSYRFSSGQGTNWIPATAIIVQVVAPQTGITVISHGFTPPGSDPIADWQRPMAEAICGRAAFRCRILTYDRPQNQFSVSSTSNCSASDTSCESILLFDWKEDSNDGPQGFSEAAADALFTALVRGSRAGTFGLSRIHLIGHSRGAVVMSETAERLLQFNASYPIPLSDLHVTYLDPHDYGLRGYGVPGVIWTDSDAANSSGYAVAAWKNSSSATVYFDAYYQQIAELKGITVPGAYTKSLSVSPCSDSFGGPISSVVTTLAGLPWVKVADSCHGKVIEWYRQTISNWNSTEGYVLSRIGGKTSLRSTYSGNATSTVSPSHDFIRNGIFNGTFSKGDQYKIAGWQYHGGGGAGLKGDSVLILGMDSSATLRQSKTHNPFFITGTANSIQFEMNVVVPWRSQTPLVVSLGQTTLATVQCGGRAARMDSSTGWQSCSAAIPSSLKNTIATLSFMAPSETLSVQAQIRNVALSTASSTPISTSPQITITDPKLNPQYVRSASVALAGGATDDVTITKVTWANDRGGSGAATLTKLSSGRFSWKVTGVKLQTGRNNITVTAYDDGNRTGTATVGIERSSGLYGCITCYVVPVDSYRFVPVTPCRVADTRAGEGFGGAFGPPALAAQSVREIPVPQGQCGIPLGAAAYSLNFTVVPPGGAPMAFITTWPTGKAMPTASTLNSLHGGIVANAAIVPAGDNGSISAYAENATELIVDINGYFVGLSAAAGLDYYPIAPCRVADTRVSEGKTGTLGPPILSGGAQRDLSVLNGGCALPGEARAYSLNATVIPSQSLGYLSLWPAGQAQPVVSTLNSLDSQVVANAAIIPAGNGGAVSAFATARTDLILDANGYFAPTASSGLRFYPVTPCRLADTRGDDDAALDAGEARAFLVAGRCDIPDTAKAYSLNVTVIPDGYLGYLTIWPTDQGQPIVSTLNSWMGRILANAAIVPAAEDGTLSVYVTHKTHVVLDVNGYFAP